MFFFSLYFEERIIRLDDPGHLAREGFRFYAEGTSGHAGTTIGTHEISDLGFHCRMIYSQVRGFVKAFAPVGLSASTPVGSYGLAEHTVACALRVTNKEGQDLDSLSDEHLQACGDTHYAVTFSHVRDDSGWEKFVVVVCIRCLAPRDDHPLSVVGGRHAAVTQGAPTQRKPLDQRSGW